MADKYVISWGKPKLQTRPAGETGAWTTWTEIVQGTAQLNTEAGNVTEAIAEGGDVVASRQDKSKYTFECELFAGADMSKPIDDDDGIILDNYSLRLIPENRKATGWVMEVASASCVDTWTSEAGAHWKYTFKGLKPETGKILKPYYSLVISPEELSFSNAADATGKPVTVTATGTVTATSNQTWATVTIAANVVTVKVAANATGIARTAVVTVSADGKTADVTVVQAG
ncbi:MAG: BACON domain-containing protein [Prevotellaceae bacterium]|jgi:hypothetical protein|nr:BACON domain-containing protein [Prevotellaceae bacterium]